MTGRLRPDAAAALTESAADELVEGTLTGERVHVEVVIPRTRVRGKMRLITRAEKSAIRADVRAFLAAKGFPVDGTAATALGAHPEWSAELAVRTLQKAVRNPDDIRRELECLDEWRECDDDQLSALIKDYEDFEARLDPLGADVELTDAEHLSLVAAAKKKDRDFLMSFGSLKLAAFAISLVDQPAISPTPKSSSTESPDSLR